MIEKKNPKIKLYFATMLRTIRTDIVIQKIFVAESKEIVHVPRDDRFLFMEQSVYKSNSIYKVSTYSLFNVWPGVNADNRKSQERRTRYCPCTRWIASFRRVERRMAAVMYPVFCKGDDGNDISLHRGRYVNARYK